MPLEKNRGLVAGSVIAIVLTTVLTLQADNKAETLLVTLGFCAVALGIVWAVLELISKGQGPSPR